jgi:hypothetical protein
LSGCGDAMRTITHFLARKGGASTSAAFAVPTPAKPGSPTAEEPSEPTLADIGARVGEENETLRNLLIDTDRRIGALDDLKDAFHNLVEPIGSALQALEHEKSDNVGLRNALAELRASHESVRSEFSVLEKRAAELESAGEELGRELALAQQAVRGLEGDKNELTSEIVAVRAEIANIESQLAQETANGRALSEANQILVDHANSADKRMWNCSPKVRSCGKSSCCWRTTSARCKRRSIRRWRKRRACRVVSPRARTP